MNSDSTSACSDIDNTDSDPDFDVAQGSDELTKTRKRKRNIEKWIQNVRKTNRNKGKQYTNKKGTVVPPRISKNCLCPLKCTDQFSEEEKADILKNFNELTEKNVQDAYLSGLIKLKPVARRKRKRVRPYNNVSNSTNNDSSDASDSEEETQHKRNATFKYFISYKNKNLNLCKMAFCGLHGIRKARVSRLCCHKRSSGVSTPPLDKRGKSEGSNKMPALLIEQVKEHIKSFPKRISHYSRQESAKRYLASDLNVSKMHSMQTPDFI